MIMLRLFFLLQHSTGAFANRICGKRFLIRIKQSKNGTSCELSADGRGLCDNRELGHEEVFDCACRRGAVWRRRGRNGKFGRRTLGLGLRWLARCLGLWWLGLPRRRMLRRLGLSRLGLGTGRLCGRRRDRRNVGDALLLLSGPGLSGLLLLFLSGARLLLLRRWFRLLLLTL